MLSTSFSLPLGQAVAAPWLTAWLTPIWLVSVGIALGLVVLALAVILFRALSFVPGWNRLSESPAGHAVALAISGGLTFLIWRQLPENVQGNADLNEPLLLSTALALLCGIIGWSIVYCSGTKAAKNAVSYLTEGAAGYMMICLSIVILIGGSVWGLAAATGANIIDNPMKAIGSIPAVFENSQRQIVLEVPAAPADGAADFAPQEIDIDFELLAKLDIHSDKQVVLADAADSMKFSRVPIQLQNDETLTWNNRQKVEELPIPYEEGTQLHIQNKEVFPAIVTIDYIIFPPVPQATTIVITALATLLLGLTLLLQQAVAPRASAVAHATVKNELAQPLFLVLMLLGVVAVLLYEFLSFNTFGEDIKLLKDCGITTIMLLATFQGIWSASSSISEEIEGKTALTVLSKPIQRRSFVVGKFLGIFWVLALMFIILGTIELGAVAYKPIYDAREASESAPVWQDCHLEMISTVPGLAMAFMQSVVLMAISVALATRLPQLANLSICFAIYVLGNLTTALISSTTGNFEIVQFVANLISVIIPILEHFSLQAAIDSGNQITMSLLSGSLLYCLLYVMLSMFLALLLFEDRDLA